MFNCLFCSLNLFTKSHDLIPVVFQSLRRSKTPPTVDTEDDSDDSDEIFVSGR